MSMLTSVLIDSNVEMARALVTEWNSLRAEECAAVLGAMLQTMAVVAERTSVKPLTAVQIQTRAAGYVIEELEFQAHRQNDSLEQALADLAEHDARIGEAISRCCAETLEQRWILRVIDNDKVARFAHWIQRIEALRCQAQSKKTLSL
jgi:hypothetical protein